jgi:tetratricopeptide (TPR) repeat protein
VSGNRQATSLGLVACLLFVLGGCVTHRPLIESSAGPVELVDTPFFPQRRYQCGPAALATMLGASHVRVTPEQLEPLVYLPGRKGSLQIEMLAAPRSYGRLTYRIEPELAAIVSELDAGRPVLVLHNYGLPFWPRWHYAVVIGHDAQKDQLLLRSGLQRREIWSARKFMRAWDNGDRWGLVMLRPGELPVASDKDRYLEAAAAFEKVAAPHDAWLAFNAAINAWPKEPVAWIGRGTAKYRDHALAEAAADYSAALQLEPSHAGARNNLAMTLLERGCPHAARWQLDKIDVTSLGEALRDAVADTGRQIDSRIANPDAVSCTGNPL